jgi:hypothetical protein
MNTLLQQPEISSITLHSDDLAGPCSAHLRSGPITSGEVTTPLTRTITRYYRTITPERLPTRRHSVTPMTTSSRDIENLIGRYALLVDGGDFTGLGALLDSADLYFNGEPPVRGRAAVEKLAADVLRTYPDGTPRTRHITTNIVLDIDEDAGTAEGSAYYTVLQAVDDFPLQPVATGSYRDRFARSDSVWRFVERHVETRFTGDTSHHVRRRRQA